MDEFELYRILLMAVFFAAGVAFVATGTVTAPYGRHARPGWGPGLGVKLGWVLMESPAAIVFALVFFAGPRSGDLVPRFFACLWLAHYVHRSFVYPLRLRGTSGKRMAMIVVALGFAFNCANAYLNARWLTALGPELTWRTVLSFHFLYGTIVFVSGFVMNRWADHELRKLRSAGDTSYKIPRGGLFDDVSCPNYLGECLQWIGWAIATWSPAGLAFAVFTCANLVPRAVSHHRWYQRTFPDYPRRRTAIIPHVL